MAWNVAAVRKLLMAAFSDEELVAFCLDYFPQVHDEFTAGQTRSTRVNLLLEYARRRGLLDELLGHIRAANPRVYDEFGPYDGPGGGSEDGASLLLEPVPADSRLIGRKGQLAAYRRKLRQDRFVIIKGMPGVGKTTLGAKLAHLEAARVEQIFWFTFDPVEKNTADALFWSLAAFLESRGAPDLWRYLRGELEAERPLDRSAKVNLLLSSLASGEYLLCFDDFHVVKEVEDVTQVFEEFQRRFAGHRQDLPVRFILMGREVPPKMEYLVSESLGGFTEEEARIFVAARRLKLPAPLMQRLWERTEGNAKLLDLSVSALLDKRSNLPAMEQFVAVMATTMGDVRDYLMTNLYYTLQPEERVVAGALAIFPVPVEPAIVEEVLAGRGINGVVPRLGALANKHIVREAADGRWHCPSLVRDYCYHVLDQADRKDFHRRAADYYERHDNLLSAAYHHFEQGARHQAAELLATHADAIINQGGAGALLEQLARFQPEFLRAEQWGRLCRVRGDALQMRGHYPQALDAYAAALDAATSDAMQAELLCVIGATHVRLWSFDQAIAKLQESLELSQRLGERSGEATAHRYLGWAYYRLNQLEQAREHFTLAERMGQELGDDSLVARSGYGLGLVEHRHGRLKEARDRLDRSRRIALRLEDRNLEARVLGDLGSIYGELGERSRQRDTYEKVVAIQTKLGDVHGLATAYNNLGYLSYELGEYDTAARYYGQFVDLARDMGHARLLSIAYSGLADTRRAAGDLPGALEAGNAARQASEGAGPGFELALSYRVLGDIQLALGNATQAEAEFAASIGLLTGTIGSAADELAKALHGQEQARSRLGAVSVPLVAGAAGEVAALQATEPAAS